MSLGRIYATMPNGGTYDPVGNKLTRGVSKLVACYANGVATIVG